MGVRIPELNTCMGTALRTGSLIILWISLINGLLLMCSSTISGGYKTNSTTSIVGNTTNTIYEVPHLDHTEMGLFQIMNNYRYYPDLGWFMVVVGGLEVMCCSFGLYGTYKNLHEHLKPYLWWHLLVMLLLVLESILYLFVVLFVNYTLLYRTTVTIVSMFFWLVVFNHYRELRERSAQPSTGIDYFS